MIGIIVMTHGDLGKEIINSCELIAGRPEYVASLSLHREDNIENFSEKFKKCLSDMEECEGVLVFVDLLGGSPSNVAMANLRGDIKYQVITGINLPMLLECVICRNEYDVESLASHCVSIGNDGIQHANKLMKQGDA